MTIAKDFASKFAVAFVAVAMIFSMFASAVSAQETTEDLQKTINDLLAQVAALQAEVPESTGAGSTASASFCPYTWTRDLDMGATGADVMKLQQFLNSDPDTRVAAAGAGSMGMETSYFGPATGAAVSKFQVKYRAEILSPINLVNPTMYFGAGSRAKANALCVTAGEAEEGEEEEEEGESSELSGEGSLDMFEIEDASDDEVQEGSEDTEIAELTLEATDGDIQITRMDIALTNVDGSDDPWEVFEEVSLWIDGEKVADMDASDEDNYLDEDDGSLRFSGLDIVLMEDEEVEILIGATIVGSVDDTLPNTWSVEANEVRYFDADGVATDDDSLEDLGPITGSGAATEVTFDIVEAGDGEELKFSLGDNNPDSTDIVVDEDDNTDGVTILEYTIEAEEGDIELNTLFVNVETSDADIVDDIYLVIDGEEFDDETMTAYSAASSTYEFDIDGDITIDEGEEVTVEVVVDLSSQSGNYTNGSTIEARVRTAETDATDAEGMDDVDEFSGSAIGEEHTLVATGILVPADSVETMADASGDNDTTGEFEITFEVTAVEGEFYINDYASQNGSTTLGGVEFAVETSGAGVASGISGTLSSSADEGTNGAFRVDEGETEEFTLNVTFEGATAGQFRVVLEEVWYSTNDAGTGAVLYTPTPAQDFRTGYKQVN